MYIAAYMKKTPVTVQPETTIAEVKALLAAKHFRHLPVVDDNGRLLGMVTDRDVRSAYPSSVTTGKQNKDEMLKISQSPVCEIMSWDVVFLPPYATLDDALILLDRQKIGALPVVDENHKVVGIFSIRDLIGAYTLLFGLGERGSALVGVKADGKPRPLTRIVHILEEHGIHFNRVVRKKDDAPGVSGETITIRVNTMNLRAVHQVLEEGGFVIDLLRPELSESGNHHA
jgi:acetoin utilization protein AcuB